MLFNVLLHIFRVPEDQLQIFIFFKISGDEVTGLIEESDSMHLAL